MLGEHVIAHGLHRLIRELLCLLLRSILEVLVRLPLLWVLRTTSLGHLRLFEGSESVVYQFDRVGFDLAYLKRCFRSLLRQVNWWSSGAQDCIIIEIEDASESLLLVGLLGLRAQMWLSFESPPLHHHEVSSRSAAGRAHLLEQYHWRFR